MSDQPKADSFEELGIDDSAFEAFTPDTSFPYAALLEEVVPTQGNFGPQARVSVRLTDNQPSDPGDGSVNKYVGGRRLTGYFGIEGAASPFQRMCRALHFPQPYRSIKWSDYTGLNAIPCMVRIRMGERSVKETDANGIETSIKVPNAVIDSFFPAGE